MRSFVSMQVKQAEA